MPTITASTRHLDAGGDDVAEYPLGEEGRLAPERKGHEHEACERRELELDQRHEELHGEDEEAQDHDEPCEQEHGDRVEIHEDVREAHEMAHLREDRLAGRDPDRRELSGLQEIGRG